MVAGEALPDHLRCNRTDGRQWRCKRRVKENLKLCEVHYLQGRHRQYKEKVPESLKLQRGATNAPKTKSDNQNGCGVQIRAKKVEIMAKLMKRKRSSESIRKAKRLKRGNSELELIRMVLKREVEKSNHLKRNDALEEDESEEELTRDLPNGLMAISSTSSSPTPPNADPDSPRRVKIGANAGPGATGRRIRSKNVEPLRIGKWQVLPCAATAAKLSSDKRKKCHLCRKSGLLTLTKCSSCETQFFCLDCIKERYFDTQEEVAEACPVCRGTCTCKDCFKNLSKDTECKDLSGEKHKVEGILGIHYLICMLLPFLKQINKDQNDELEIEAKVKGKKPTNLDVMQAESEKDFSELTCCKCRSYLVDLHRSCPNCSYNLCLSCCRDLREGNFQPGKIPMRNKIKSVSKFLDSGGTLCPVADSGGCGESFIKLRCLLPSDWIRDLEEMAEEIACSYEFPETSDINARCSICLGTNQKSQLQEVSVRKDSSDNFLYYPTLIDIHSDNVEHFQKHWVKGQPVVVRNVLKAASHLSWDPILMFCNYLERSISRYEYNRNLCEATACLDWCEVEIGIKQCFMGSFKGETRKNTWSESLKLKGWLSSQLFQQQFPAHYAEIIHTLPLQEYMNPASGLLNIAARLPLKVQRPDFGPCLYMSYGHTEQHSQSDSVIKLHYDSYDMVNVLAHTSDNPISAEQLSKVRKLLKKHKAQKQSSSSRVTSDQNLTNRIKKKASLHDDKTKDRGMTDIIGEEMHIRKKVAQLPCSSKDSNMSDAESGSDSDSDVEDSLEKQKNLVPHIKNMYNKKDPAPSFGAQWDIFRRQDVPKLVEYLTRHSNEFASANDSFTQVVHPIFDQRFFLDTTHKTRLKEEFEIEPWTFEQRLGEAVIIPAGCPYQISSPKSCVHVVLDFISPENVMECVQLTDEIRQLPEDHKAKVDKLEVTRMALHSISEAVKEIRELTCTM